jgi:hypothetical protein
MAEALVWPQRLHYKKAGARVSESIEIASPPTCYLPARNVGLTEDAGSRGARFETARFEMARFEMERR